MKANDGYSVGDCPVCRKGPVRDDGTEKRGPFNFMRTCVTCGSRCCLVCLPDDARECVGCIR